MEWGGELVEEDPSGRTDWNIQGKSSLHPRLNILSTCWNAHKEQAIYILKNILCDAEAEAAAKKAAKAAKKAAEEAASAKSADAAKKAAKKAAEAKAVVAAAEKAKEEAAAAKVQLRTLFDDTWKILFQCNPQYPPFKDFTPAPLPDSYKPIYKYTYPIILPTYRKNYIEKYKKILIELLEKIIYPTSKNDIINNLDKIIDKISKQHLKLQELWKAKKKEKEEDSEAFKI